MAFAVLPAVLLDPVRCGMSESGSGRGVTPFGTPWRRTLLEAENYVRRVQGLPGHKDVSTALLIYASAEP